MSFDPKCYELAEYFLRDQTTCERVIHALAQEIQDTIEDFSFDEPDEDPRHDARDRDEWKHEAAQAQRLK